MKVIYTDVLVIGAGLAGLRMAVGAKRKGHDSIILSLVPPKRSHSKAAQGGMQASLANVIKGVGDNEDVHFGDTVRGSDWGADQEVVRMFVNTAPKAVRELAAWGVPWSRITPGDRQVIINGEKVTITERQEAAGLLAQRDFGGTKKWRTCFVSDGTGHAMLNAVSDRAIAEGIPIHERVEAIALIHDGVRCYGAVVRDLITGELIGYVAKATAIATGGAGKIFRVSTNAQICEGTGHAIALETGVATCGNMEAVQFHPTGIFPAGILVTEGCRGDGGLLRDVDGHRFMPDVEPEKKELASRDVVSRRMEERIAQGKGVKSRFGEHLWLDITLLGEHHIKHNLREVYEICHYFLGVDPTKDWIPVRPAQHYTMGGVRTKPSGESENLKGLFAAGEAACWDMHGFNRLGGNSVAETVVAGMIVGESIADFCDKPENAIDIPTKVVYDFIRREQDKLDRLVKNGGTENMAEIRTRMQEIMTTKVGIFRTGEKLSEAVNELEDLYKKSFNVAVKNQPGANPELVYAYRTQKMLRVALSMALGASLRTESRGAHFRIDYPVRNDKEWCKRTLSTWKNENDTLPTITYQDLDISKMELPPGWRGYGAKNYIDNPETPIRQKQVDEIRAKMEAQGADRFAIQNALMPYQDLLPEDLRGKNERIDEPLP
jgi:fumarate reductase flavoprotein subunit